RRLRVEVIETALGEITENRAQDHIEFTRRKIVHRVSLLRAAEPRPDPLDDLPVSLGESRRICRPGIGTGFNVAKHRQQDLNGLQIGFGRPLDQLGDDGLTLGDLTSPAILDYDDWLAQRLVQQVRQVLRSARSPSRVAGPTQLETGVAGWLAIADLIVALVVRRHRLPPP